MTSQANVARLSAGMLAAFAAIYFFWGTTFLAIALAIKTVPPFISGGVRFLLAGVLMYSWLRWRNPQPLTDVNVPMAALVGFLLSGMGNGFVVWAQQGIPSGIAALIVTSVPVIVLLLDWMFFSKRMPTISALIGTALAVAGVATIATHTHSLAGAANPWFIVAMFVATTAWSFGTLIQKRSARPDAVLGFTCVQMFFGGLSQLLFSVLDNEWAHFDVASVSVQSVLAIVYLIVFGSLVTFNCYLWLLTRAPATQVATYALVNPVVALVLGALVLDERLTTLAVGAAVLVLLGVGLVLFPNPKWLQHLRRREADQDDTVATTRSR